MLFEKDMFFQQARFLKDVFPFKAVLYCKNVLKRHIVCWKAVLGQTCVTVGVCSSVKLCKVTFSLRQPAHLHVLKFDT